jgi:hypothetical protein
MTKTRGQIVDPTISHEMSSRRRVATALILLGSIVVVLLVAFLVIPNHNGELLNPTADHSEPLTELYFEDHLRLPTTFLPGAEETFRFTIHNLENKPTTYTYVVSVNNAPITNPQRLTLANGAAKSVSTDVPLDVKTPRAYVDIELTNINQAIGYWVTRR